MSTTSLKILALIFMVMDHIALFIPSMPIWFRWIGRISAPLFIFCTVWGIYYTKNRKLYLFRMYLFGIFMAVIILITKYFKVPGNIPYIRNNIFVTLFLICVLITIIEYIISGHYKWRKYLIYFILWQLCSTIFIIFIINMFPLAKTDELFYGAILGNIFFNEGGIPYICLGLILYFTKTNKKILGALYLIFCISYFLYSFFSISTRICLRINYYFSRPFYEIVSLILSLIGTETIFITPLSSESFFYYHYEWALIFALPFIFLYNNKKGKGLKYLFYFFYPIHIIILYYIGNLISLI